MEEASQPQPGQDGYLAQCAAPNGDQQKYQLILLRAAWLYIQAFGSPNNGVTPNKDAWAIVLKAFPGLSKNHFVLALDQVHMQVYGRVV